MLILREPIVWYVIFTFVSLLVTFVLFKYLKSAALIQRKEYLFGGAVAGFLAIFFIGWYTFYPALKVPVGQVAPTNIPSGYEVYSDPAFAVAIPNDYAPSRTYEVGFTRQKSDVFFKIIVIENVPLERFMSLKGEDIYPEKDREALAKLMPNFKITGPMQDAPFQGRRGYIWPVEITIPDDPAFEEERGTYSKALFHTIFDEQSQKIFFLAYDDTPEAKKVVSTFNLPKR